MTPQADQVELRRAAADLDEARAALAAVGVILASAAYAMSDALRREAKRQRAERAEQRASKPTKPPAPKTRRRGR